MTDDQKREFDAISTLRSWAWTGMDHRREYEWKVSIGIWTALSALTGILLTGRLAMGANSHHIRLGSIIFGIAVFGLHLFFRLGIENANESDLRLEKFYNCLLRKRLISPLLSKEEEKQLACCSKRTGIKYYSLVFQVAITFLLSVSVVVAVFLNSK